MQVAVFVQALDQMLPPAGGGKARGGPFVAVGGQQRTSMRQTGYQGVMQSAADPLPCSSGSTAAHRSFPMQSAADPLALLVRVDRGVPASPC